MRTPNLQAMSAFRRVVELHSFHAAARDLDVASGTVSKLVAQLETDLGVRLLNRSTRRVSVNEAGTGFYEAAVRILDELAMATEQVRAQSSEVQGRLKAAVPTSFALMWLAGRVPAFAARHPQLTLDLALNDGFVDLVQEGFDCALRITTRLPDSQLVARPLGRIERVLVAAPAYLRRAPALRKPEDLKAHECLLYTQSITPNEWPLRGTAQGRPVQVGGRYRVNNSVMLRDALLAGQGVALTPRFVVADLLASGALAEVLARHRPLDHQLFGLVAQQRYTPRKVSAFLDFVEGQMKGP